MAGEGLDFSALRTKQGLQVSVGGVIYRCAASSVPRLECCAVK